MAISKGKWTPGKTGGTVVSDSSEGFNNATGHDDTTYYGGYLIAESIAKEDDIKLISAAPDLLEALTIIIEANRDVLNMPDYVLKQAEAAIKKASA